MENNNNTFEVVAEIVAKIEKILSLDMNTQVPFISSAEAYAIAYAPALVRKGLSRAVLQSVKAHTHYYTFNNKKDPGGAGRAYEIALRGILVPQSIVLKTQGQGKTDVLRKHDNKVVRIEAKTGRGNFTMQEPGNVLSAFAFDYISYCRIYDGQALTAELDSVVMTRDAFIDWLCGYNGSLSGMTYVHKDGRKVYLQAWRGSKRKLAYYDNLYNLAGTIEGIMFMEDFLELLNK